MSAANSLGSTGLTSNDTSVVNFFANTLICVAVALLGARLVQAMFEFLVERGEVADRLVYGHLPQQAALPGYYCRPTPRKSPLMWSLRKLRLIQTMEVITEWQLLRTKVENGNISRLVMAKAPETIADHLEDDQTWWRPHEVRHREARELLLDREIEEAISRVMPAFDYCPLRKGRRKRDYTKMLCVAAAREALFGVIRAAWLLFVAAVVTIRRLAVGGNACSPSALTYVYAMSGAILTLCFLQAYVEVQTKRVVFANLFCMPRTKRYLQRWSDTLAAREHIRAEDATNHRAAEEAGLATILPDQLLEIDTSSSMKKADILKHEKEWKAKLRKVERIKRSRGFRRVVLKRICGEWIIFRGPRMEIVLSLIVVSLLAFIALFGPIIGVVVTILQLVYRTSTGTSVAACPDGVPWLLFLTVGFDTFTTLVFFIFLELMNPPYKKLGGVKVRTRKRDFAALLLFGTPMKPMHGSSQIASLYFNSINFFLGEPTVVLAEYDHRKKVHSPRIKVQIKLEEEDDILDPRP
jgi:hypothetical protein|tara:strand:- start:1497 stop:3068 length:1572 start_codon:yes stop_codon:yes gene_type:complete